MRQAQPFWTRLIGHRRSLSLVHCSLFIVPLVLALVAAAPFLTRPGLPRDTDAELHVYRAAELGHTLRAGALYPRWAPDFYYGYGYPIFNYYAPFTYYLANLFDVIPGIDIVGGIKAVFVLGLVLAALGTYLLGRELFSPGAGVLAAASFTFAPYVVFIDPHARGDLAEHFAVCLLPLAMVAFHRLVSGVGGRWALLGSTCTLAAIVFSHNLLGLVSGGLLFVYWLWQLICRAAFHSRRNGPGEERRVWKRALQDSRWKGLTFAFVAFILAAALIAFFWLPALLERDAVKLDVVGPGHFDFREHFLSLGELLAPSRVLDLGASAPRYRFNLGLAQWLLALMALPALIVSLCRPSQTTNPPHPQPPTPPTSHTSTLLFFLLSSLVLILLMLPASTIIWERVPWMAYLQFPWRLLGPANVMLAMCAAGGTTLLPAGRWRDPALAATLIGILLLALPVLYPPMWTPDFGPTTAADIIDWEMHSRGRALGTTSTGDFVPVEAALVRMHPVGSLVESYWGPGPVDRVNRASLPDDANVEILEHGPLHDRFAVSTPDKFVLRLFTFYFPGWRAYVDGAEVEIEVAGPEGFITLWVPAGEHEVLVRFEDTSPRTAGWLISATALVALVIFMRVMRPSRAQETRFLRKTWFLQALWPGGAILLFFLLKTVVIDPHDDWLRYTSPSGQAWAAQYQRQVGFYALDGSPQIELLGYDLPRQRVRAGETVPLVLYWHALAPLDENYQTFVHLAQPLHILWGQEDHLNPGGLPTKEWPLDKYVWDAYEVHVLPGTPPGEYLLNVGLPSWSGGYRLQRRDESGQVVGDSVVIASLAVERPRRQPALAELEMTGQVMARFSPGGVTLLGYAQPQDQATLPGVWPITLFWRADQDRPPARTRDLVLLDAAGSEAARLSGSPVDGRYPFEMWQAGEIVRDPFLFVLPPPAELQPGTYRFGVVVGGEFVSLGSVEFE